MIDDIVLFFGGLILFIFGITFFICCFMLMLFAIDMILSWFGNKEAKERVRKRIFEE